MGKFEVDDFVRVEMAMESSFASDGRSVAFRSNRSGAPQAWIVDAQGEGRTLARQLTDTSGVVYSARTRPGHAELLYVTDAGGDEQYQLQLLDLETGTSRALTERPDRIHTPGGWSRDGAALSFASNRRDRRFFDIHVLDVASGRDELVYCNDGMNAAGRFDEAGTSLLVSRPNLEAGAGDNDLFRVSLHEPGVADHLTPHDGVVHWSGATFLPGGDVLALSDEERDFMALQRLPAGGGKRSYTLEFDWDIEQFAVSPDGTRLVASVNQDGYSRLFAYELDRNGAPGSALPLPEVPGGVISLIRWRPDGGAITFTLSSASLPSGVWIAEIGAAEAVRVSQSSLGPLPPDVIPEPAVVRYPSFDGLEIPAFFYVPRERPAGARLPCLILVHGGPEAQARPTLWGNRASAASLLARGEIALLVPNVRGSTGYGKAYQHADDVERRMDSVRDLIAATDWLAETGIVDPERIGVAGGSYGGFMTLAAITEAPDRWAAAVDLFGIANFETFMERTGSWRRAHRAAEYGSDPAFLRSISPIHKADRITAPLLVVQGDQDVRVPPHESEQIVETVRSNGGVVDYLLFEQEGHGIQKLPNRLAMERRITEFLEEHLLG